MMGCPSDMPSPSTGHGRLGMCVHTFVCYTNMDEGQPVCILFTLGFYCGMGVLPK